MEQTLRQIHKLLIKKQATLAVAESCTGGLLSEALTRLAGSSQYFILGLVAYSNKAKTTLLGIPLTLLNNYGAVSQETAQKMAQGIRKLAKTDFGLAVTGIAGPAGGTPEKPPGTVFVAVAAKNKQLCKKFCLAGKRLEIRKKSALKALELLKRLL